MRKILLLCLLSLMGCANIQLESNWKNPDHVIFTAYKVLIVGMTNDEEARIAYETKMQREFTKRDIEAMRSIDLFDVDFTSGQRNEDELSQVEQQLLDKDFDAILFTKVVSAEDKKRFGEKLAELDDFYGTFRDDYMQHQDIFYKGKRGEELTLYHTETSLYCICVDKERELIWRGVIEITEPLDLKKTIDSYVKLVVQTMEEQDLIFRKKQKE
ncbi:hypothetical protein HCG49_04105 [Arenibacter sp. 6A1]|uniref:hypothetical protein n=1 Tax=Arenibacter sp. 6A1 TaxID=2720391 RepID=UPI00144642E2|nr:hypothetical protein [Arenibacter sp. 6A1]NKI25740.1 hypothetical protein [Arenibacter sp. 6A1]